MSPSLNSPLPKHLPLAEHLGATLKVRFGSRFSQGESIRIPIIPYGVGSSVEVGVTRLQMNAALKGSGLFVPIDPGDNVPGMTVILADGQIITADGGQRTSADRAGDCRQFRRPGVRLGDAQRGPFAPVAG